MIYKRLAFIFFIFLYFAICPFGCQAGEGAFRQEKMISITKTGLDTFNEDPVMNLLGKNFDEIIQVLGEPDEQGNSSWYGPHYFILYTHNEGVIRFCSPEDLEKEIAVSIILGPGKEVLDTRVGMTFPEIKDILGTPAFGPELSMDNLYYMDYFIGEINEQVPEYFISYSADAINSPTKDVFIKWEAFGHEIVEIVEMM